MEFGRVQKTIAGTVEKIDEKLGVRRDELLTISQLVEELGELARAVNSEKLGRGKIELEKLEDEFATSSFSSQLSPVFIKSIWRGLFLKRSRF
ncbi:hypothetical protein DRP07_08530 [Archaeoglobales archaeon]|nr:MAG: hypothetical protein DRP07_08530 [Archaeoglobales archaeon]